MNRRDTFALMVGGAFLGSSAATIAATDKIALFKERLTAFAPHMLFESFPAGELALKGFVEGFGVADYSVALSKDDRGFDIAVKFEKGAANFVYFPVRF